MICFYWAETMNTRPCVKYFEVVSNDSARIPSYQASIWSHILVHINQVTVWIRIKIFLVLSIAGFHTPIVRNLTVWNVTVSCWCGTHQQCGQGISVSAVDWQRLQTASKRWRWHCEHASTDNGKQSDWSQIRAVGCCCQSTAETEIPWPHCWCVLHQHWENKWSVEIK